MCLNHETKKNQPYGFVTLPNREIAETAINVMKGCKNGRRKIDVKFARGKVNKKPENFIPQPPWVVANGNFCQPHLFPQDPKVKYKK